MDDFLHPWDERYHALVAKNMLDNPLKPMLYKHSFFDNDNLDWRHSSIWLHKQPLTLWIISFSFFLFGTDEFFIRLPSLFMSTGSIIIIFLIAQKLFNPKVGLISSFFFSINGFISEISSGRIATDHVDVIFMFFILFASYLVLLFKDRPGVFMSLSIGIFIGLAVMCKWLPAYIVLLFFYVYNTKYFSSTTLCYYSLIITIISMLIFIPWQIYIFSNYREYAAIEYLNMRLHFTEVLDGQTGSVFYYLDKIRINYHDLVYLPLLYFIVNYKKYRDVKYIIFFIWIFIPIIVFSFAKTKMQGYILFISPAIFILIALFIDELFGFNIKKAYILILGLAFFTMPLIGFVDRVLVKKYNEDKQKVMALKMALKKIPDDFFVLLNCDNYIEAMYYSNCTAYPHVPEKIYDAVPKGINVYKFIDGNYSKLVKVN